MDADGTAVRCWYVGLFICADVLLQLYWCRLVFRLSASREWKEWFLVLGVFDACAIGL